MIEIVEIEGNEPALVFTHGLGDDHTTWSEQIAHFRGRHHLLVWDLPGHGASPAPATAEECTRDAALEHLAEVVHRAAGPVVLVGHSLGGYLSMAYALRHPHDVVGLVLEATGPGFRDPEAREKWNEFSSGARDWFPDAPHVAKFNEQHDSLVIDGLPEIQVPVLLVVGERDRRYHDGMSYMDRKLAHSRSLVLEDAGHHPHTSSAAEFNTAMEIFLRVPSLRP